MNLAIKKWLTIKDKNGEWLFGNMPNKIDFAIPPPP